MGTALNFQSKDTRIICLNNNGNGIIDALKTGDEKAKGKFISRMDADDIMGPEKIELMRSKLINSGKRHVSIGLVSYFATNKKLENGYIKYQNWLNALSLKNDNYTDIYKECTIPSPCWMLYNDDFNSINRFNQLTYPEDYDLAFKMYYSKIKPVSVKRKIHFWRDHPDRVSRNSKTYELDNFINLKISYFIKNEWKKGSEIGLWGAGKKGKLIANALIQKNIPFEWITNNSKKEGHYIYGKQINNIKWLDLKFNKKIICAISSKGYTKPSNTEMNQFFSFY